MPGSTTSEDKKVFFMSRMAIRDGGAESHRLTTCYLLCALVVSLQSIVQMAITAHALWQWCCTRVHKCDIGGMTVFFRELFILCEIYITLYMWGEMGDNFWKYISCKTDLKTFNTKSKRSFVLLRFHSSEYFLILLTSFPQDLSDTVLCQKRVQFPVKD